MHLRNQSVIIQASRFVKKLAVSVVVAVALCKRVEAEKTPSDLRQEQEWHPLLILDTKYWSRNTEFTARDNWLNQLRPCTLLERVKLNEQSVISLGNSFDMYSGAIESTIKELTLAENGMLLLEDDIPIDPIDLLFIQYLNSSHDCLDSTNLGHLKDENGPIFEFQPESDDMSWFNPANWNSEKSSGEIYNWLPESHQIPCIDDTIVFGSEAASLMPLVEPERSTILSFKVNFKASSELNKELSDANVSVSGVQVSRLKIGNQVYNQNEFQQLTSSKRYENILFEFNGGLVKPELENTYPARHPLLIDDSTIQQIDGNEYCIDEAGCLCGNEKTSVMKIICSFNQPIDYDELPCYDPVSSEGYCNKICASVITVTMNPDRFSERYIANILTNAITNGTTSDYFLSSIFASSRRVGYVKYEITIRHRPNLEYDYESTLGREQEFAQLIVGQLNKRATKSFYGIKSILVKSSVNWRKNSRQSIFWISYSLLSVIALFVFIYYNSSDRHNQTSDTIDEQFHVASHWLSNTLRNIINHRSSNSDKSDSFIRFSEPNIVAETEENYLSEIPLIRLRPEQD